MNRVRSFSRRLLWFMLALSFAIEAAAFLEVHVNAQTQPTPSDDQVNAVASQLLFPVGTNIPLDMCQSQACAQWRDLIRDKLAAGWTNDQIKQFFVDQYGDRVLMVPPPRGINWFLYLITAAILIGAIYFVVHFIRHSPRQNEIDLSDSTLVNAQYLKDQLDRDLKEDK